MNTNIYVAILAQARLKFQLYCTMAHVQDYTLTARQANEPFYALIIISSMREAPEGNDAHIYMVEKVQPVSSEDVARLRPLLKRLSMFSKTSASVSAAAYNSPIKWEPGRGPASARKARRLGYHPTASPIRSPPRDD